LQAFADLEEGLESASLATTVQVEALKFELSMDSSLCCTSDSRRAFSFLGVQLVWSEQQFFFLGLVESVLDDADAIVQGQVFKLHIGVAKGYF
jgi:hypothetical protein